MTPPARIQFSIRDLIWIITGFCAWLAIIRYLGPMTIILSSPILGGWFLFVGTVFRLRIVAFVGAVLFFAGPFLLGVLFAFLDR